MQLFKYDHERMCAAHQTKVEELFKFGQSYEACLKLAQQNATPTKLWTVEQLAASWFARYQLAMAFAEDLGISPNNPCAIQPPHFPCGTRQVWSVTLGEPYPMGHIRPDTEPTLGAAWIYMIRGWIFKWKYRRYQKRFKKELKYPVSKRNLFDSQIDTA